MWRDIFTSLLFILNMLSQILTQELTPLTPDEANQLGVQWQTQDCFWPALLSSFRDAEKQDLANLANNLNRDLHLELHFTHGSRPNLTNCFTKEYTDPPSVTGLSTVSYPSKLWTKQRSFPRVLFPSLLLWKYSVHQLRSATQLDCLKKCEW